MVGILKLKQKIAPSMEHPKEKKRRETQIKVGRDKTLP